MKRSEWTRNFWVKAVAFALALLLVPIICVNAVALVCAYENHWLMSRTPDLYQTDVVMSAVYRQMANVEDYYEHFGSDIVNEKYFTHPSATNYRFALYDENNQTIFDNLSTDGVALGITAPLFDEAGKGRIESGVARELQAQDGIYWAIWFARQAHRLFPYAVPVLTGSVLALALLVIYLARAAGRQPGEERAVAQWQEKIPFDLYLFLVLTAATMILYFCAEAANSYSFMRDLPLYLALYLTAALVEAALVLATWMTFCTRVKLGQWWRNTVTFRALALCWRLAKWCLQRMRSAGRGLCGALRGIPLVWKTMLVLCGVSLPEFIVFLNSGMHEENFFLWLILRMIACAILLFAALQLRTLQAGGEALAAGNLDAKVDTSRMVWDFKRHGENLNDIARGMQLAVDRQLKSERLKTELITNVSHDIKTPLTSIINYVGLLRRDPDAEQAREYLEVLDRQSQRLKKLTEDLVEVSKASTGNMTVNASRRSINELLLQALGEYSERLERAQLEAVLTLPEKELCAWADGTLLWRVVDNVLSNACKYALPGTRFYIDAQERENRVRLSFKNISRDRLNVSADELMERFVRGDASRGGEGSGLGLNIAKSLAELQGGTFSLSVDGDLFRVDLTLPSAA